MRRRHLMATAAVVAVLAGGASATGSAAASDGVPIPLPTPTLTTLPLPLPRPLPVQPPNPPAALQTPVALPAAPAPPEAAPVQPAARPGDRAVPVTPSRGGARESAGSASTGYAELTPLSFTAESLSFGTGFGTAALLLPGLAPGDIALDPDIAPVIGTVARAGAPIDLPGAPERSAVPALVFLAGMLLACLAMPAGSVYRRAHPRG